MLVALHFFIQHNRRIVWEVSLFINCLRFCKKKKNAGSSVHSTVIGKLPMRQAVFAIFGFQQTYGNSVGQYSCCRFLWAHQQKAPIQGTARSKAWACGRSLAGNAGSNPAEGIGVCLLRVLCFLQVEFSVSSLSLFQRRKERTLKITTVTQGRSYCRIVTINLTFR